MSFLRRLRALHRKDKLDAEMSEEMRLHVELQTERNITAGMDADEARYAALRMFGGVEQIKERCREQRVGRWVETLWRDARSGVRVLRHSPGFTVIAVATLALGIGASSAVFSVVEAILLRPLPYQNPGQLVDVGCELAGAGRGNLSVSVPEIEDLRDRAGVFAELSMVFPMHGNLTGVDQPQRVEALAVSPGYFRVLGVAPALGRTFAEEEASTPGWAQGCVLSHEAWLNYFGGDTGVIGRKFYMDYDTYRVIGVMPAGFRHPGRTLATDVDVWFTGGLRTPPFSPEPQRGFRIIPGMIGRLADGLTVAEAQARLEVFAEAVRRDFPQDYAAAERWTPRVQALQEHLTGSVRPVLWMLFGAVSLVLLICCATLANLLLVRATGRRQEMAVRCALGASRGAVVRQLVVESLLVALAGGAAGLLLAWWLPPLMVSLAPVSLPRVNGLAINASVLGFAFAVSSATGVLFGLVPALQATKFNLVTSLKDGARAGGATRGAERWRAGLVVAQVALSLVLLAGGGLLLKSFWNAWRIEPGFEPRGVVLGEMWLPPPSDPTARQAYLSHENRVTLMRELVRRLRSLPGVESAAVGMGAGVPLAGNPRMDAFTIESNGKAAGDAGTALRALVTPDYFRVLGIPLRQGRAFDEADDGRARVAVVNEAAAARYWPGQNPIGQRLAPGRGNEPAWCTIVGVVGNVKTTGLDAPDTPQIYFPAYQESRLGVAFFVRGAGGTAALAEPLRREIHGIDADLPVYGVRTMEDVMAGSLSQRRFAAVVVGGFAGVALALAALGIYGVIALTVTQRTREIGVRMALGAQRRQILALVLRRGLALTAIGAGIGGFGAVVIARTMRGMLFATDPLDPVTWLTIAALLGGAALIACWLPARRATKVDPVVALRAE